jgi:hypothetical protein
MGKRQQVLRARPAIGGLMDAPLANGAYRAKPAFLRRESLIDHVRKFSGGTDLLAMDLTSTMCRGHYWVPN